MASVAPTAPAAPAKGGWVFGPVPDLLLGCGAGYVVVAALVSLLPADRSTLLLWGGLLTAFTGMPHYGATLLRVYEHREDRRRYALFAVWATLAVWAVFAWGVYEVIVGSWLLTIYLTWSPWHYTGQNYGLAVMFLRRNGVDLDPGTKRLVYTSFLLSYALALLTLHSDSSTNAYGPEIVGFTYAFLPVGLPLPVYGFLFLCVFVAYLFSLAFAAWRLRGVARKALAPAAMLVGTQALWFSAPSFAVWFTGYPLPTYDVAFLFVWIAIGHAVQYLWITTYYAAGSRSAGAKLRYLGKTLFAGAIVWTVPALLFAPGVLGESSYLLGLYMLVASAVNIQHFILDGAIWKLRDGRVARILLAPAEPGRPEPIEARPRRGGPALFLCLGAVCSFVAIVGSSLFSISWRGAVEDGDAVRAARVERWLRFMGRDEPAFWNRRAGEGFQRADYAAAAELYRQSLALYPNPDAWIGIAEVRLARNDREGAREALRESLEVHPTALAWSGIGLLTDDQDAAAAAFDAALELDPRDVTALQRYGQFWLAHGDREKARTALQRAARLAPGNSSVRHDLDRALR